MKREWIIDACSGKCIDVTEEQRITVVDLEGGQVVDFFCRIGKRYKRIFIDGRHDRLQRVAAPSRRGSRLFQSLSPHVSDPLPRRRGTRSFTPLLPQRNVRFLLSKRKRTAENARP